MAKIKLGTKPETFAPFPVKFKMPDGTEGVINVTFKYRDREEFGAFQNNMLKGADAQSAIGEDGKLDYAKLYKQVGSSNADYLMGCVHAWDMDYDLTRDVLLQFARELPAGAVGMLQAYDLACTQGRLGN
jgi:hypothetical protein